MQADLIIPFWVCVCVCVQGGGWSSVLGGCVVDWARWRVRLDGPLILLLCTYAYLHKNKYIYIYIYKYV